ncbi:MAG: ATP-binding protein [bacterium]
MFINRERELTHLLKAYHSKQAEFIVIYGKRRVGKTELIKHSLKNVEGVYFLSQKITEHENLKFLSQILSDKFNDSLLQEHPLTNWNQVFIYLQQKVKSLFVLAIDEFPYLIEVNPSTASIFQSGWEQILSKLPIKLVLCGSSVSMMESSVLGEKSPLFGRRTSQILLNPFKFAEVRLYFADISFEHQIELYSVLGGNPGYLKQFDSSLALEENISRNILAPESYLYREVDFLMREELRDPHIYLSILSSIAYGKRKTSEIINSTSLQKNILHKYLSVLENLRMINKEIPITEHNAVKSRKALYELSDNFLKFYFRFILPNRSAIEEQRTKHILTKIRAEMPLIASVGFETACKEWLDSNWLEFPLSKIGGWWDKNEEIDLIGFDNEMKNAVFCECKWSNKKVGTDILDEIKRKSELLMLNDKVKKHYALFSKSGFTDNLISHKKKFKNIHLFSLKDLNKS